MKKNYLYLIFVLLLNLFFILFLFSQTNLEVIFGSDGGFQYHNLREALNGNFSTSSISFLSLNVCLVTLLGLSNLNELNMVLIIIMNFIYLFISSIYLYLIF